MKQRRLALTIYFLFMQALQGCGPEDGFAPPFEDPLPRIAAKVGNFSSCDDLQNWYQGQQEAWRRINATYSGAVAYAVPFSASVADAGGAPSSPGGPATATVTNVQVPGIDEPDLVKAFAGRLFYARAHSVEVFSAHDLSPVTTLTYNALSNLQLLRFANRLAVIGRTSGSVEVHIVKDSGGRLTEERSFSFPGHLLAARQQASDLTLVMSSPLSNEPPQMPCARIARPVLENSYEFDMTAVHTLNLAAEDVTSDSMAAIGAADQVYMSEKNIYLFRTGYTWFNWDLRSLKDPLYNGSIVSKLELRQGHAPRLIAAAVVSGHTRNNLAFSEDKTGRYLFIATTTGWPQSNRLWVLGDNPAADESPFTVVAATQDFGMNEDIRAVRFIGERAYVVTFQKTDPLFVFDLSRPERPRLMSELEIPGFSAYLHSLGPSLLFGAGYGGVPEQGFAWLAGVQLSLFDLHDDGTVALREQKQFGGRGSHVDAAHDYHAFALDARTGFIALPVKIMALDPNITAWTYSGKIEFTGALVIDPASGLEPVGRLTHSEWIPEPCREQLTALTWWNDNRDSLDIRRVVAVENGLVSLSPFGVKLHASEPPFAARAARSFDEPERECPRYPWWY